MYKFIFDVDGTLTPSRAKIDSSFLEFFTDFCNVNDVYLVTGSDIDKTTEQLGNEIISKVNTIYACSGNDVWSKGKNIRTSNWKIPEQCIQFLNAKLKDSLFVLRTGNHIEHRPGTVNFSVLGRNATLSERQLYKKWDYQHNEREKIVQEFNSLFPEICAKIGGETGIDIFPIGYDKSQILKDFNTPGRLLFFGDRMDELGNDFPLKEAINKNSLGECFEVKDWKHTQKILFVMRLM